ncbi:hypothetical protein HYD80_02480 [Mycoplasmopsis bovis]|nr:hypothetical protein [Mycoplasmopsis bovis]QQH42863.1 hypothetical protein HYD80_02480 [Mycoplasmopsis bovis]
MVFTPKDENGKIEFHFINFRNNFKGTACFRNTVVGQLRNQDTKEALILGTKGISF